MIACFLPVAFFGGKDEERDSDVWINGERYRKLIPDGKQHDWASSEYKLIDVVGEE